MAAGDDLFKDLFSYPQNAESDKDSNHLLVPKNHMRMKIVPMDGPSGMVNYELLLNPTSISESKASNWAKHYVPGYDSPLLQWINGGERIISFTALVTKDLAENPTYSVDGSNKSVITVALNPDSGVINAYSDLPKSDANILNGLTDAYNNNAVSGVDQSLANAVLTATQRNLTKAGITDTGLKKPNIPNKNTRLFLSVAAQLDFYRSLLLPRKLVKGRKSTTPPLVRLEMGDILGDKYVVSKQRFILLSLSINVTKMSPELDPIEAQVSFNFIEYSATGNYLTQVGKDPKATNTVTTPIDANSFRTANLNGSTSATGGLADNTNPRNLG